MDVVSDPGCQHDARLRRYGRKRNYNPNTDDDPWWAAYMCPARACAPQFITTSQALIEWVEVQGSPDVAPPVAPPVAHAGDPGKTCAGCMEMYQSGIMLHEVIAAHNRATGQSER